MFAENDAGDEAPALTQDEDEEVESDEDEVLEEEDPLATLQTLGSSTSMAENMLSSSSSSSPEEGYENHPDDQDEECEDCEQNVMHECSKDKQISGSQNSETDPR